MTITTVAATTTVTVDLIDVITVTAEPTVATMIGTAVIIITTITAMIIVMTDATTTAAMIAMKTTAMIGGMIAATTDVMIVVARTTTTATRKIARSLSTTTAKRGNHNVAFQTLNQQINFIVGGRQAAKSNRQQRSNAREIGQVNTENPQSLRWSEYLITFSRKDHWVHIPDPRIYPLVVNTIVDDAFLPKTFVDGGSSLNIIFTETLRKMDFNFNKMTTCDEPFYCVVPGKAAYPIGRVCLPVTFGTKENFRTEYLTFEVWTSAPPTMPFLVDLCWPSSWLYHTTPTSS
jgi:tRNA threonylcarbamoyladenosine modification (KEOPS) complex Cgi121 subunit